MAIVRPETNRADSFAKAHGIAEQDVHRWNITYFLNTSTFFLPVGEDFRTSPPTVSLGRSIVVNDNLLTVNDGDQLAVI